MARVKLDPPPGPTTARLDLEAFAGGVYAAAVEGGWEGALEHLRKGIGAQMVLLVTCDIEHAASEIITSAGLAPEFAAAYAERFAGCNLWSRYVPALSAPAIVALDERHSGNGDRNDGHFYTEWLQPQGLVQALIGIAERRGDVILYCVALRTSVQSAFNHGALSDFARAVGHLERGLEVHGLLSAAELLRDAAMDALNRMPIGVLIMDEGGRILGSNQHADDILALNDGLSLDRAGLRASRNSDASALKSEIASALDPAMPSGHRGRALPIHRPSGLRPFAALVSPLHVATRLRGRQRRAAALFVADPEGRNGIDVGRLERLYGLTPSEARLAALLAGGQRLEEAAEHLGVSLHTVRTHLKRVFSKTGTTRQADLVRLIISGPAQFADH